MNTNGCTTPVTSSDLTYRQWEVIPQEPTEPEPKSFNDIVDEAFAACGKIVKRFLQEIA